MKKLMAKYEPPRPVRSCKIKNNNLLPLMHNKSMYLSLPKGSGSQGVKIVGPNRISGLHILVLNDTICMALFSSLEKTSSKLKNLFQSMILRYFKHELVYFKLPQ